MLITAVLCLCAAGVVAGGGVWSLTRPRPDDPVGQVLRSVAPTQLAAAVMLAAGGAVALSAEPRTGVLVIVCAVGAVGTVAAGCWQGAKVAVARAAATAVAADAGCAGSCAACTLSCR